MMKPIFVIFLFSLHVTSSSNITSVYSMEHIPAVKKKDNMSSRKLNLPPIIQREHMFDDPLFFPAPIF